MKQRNDLLNLLFLAMIMAIIVVMGAVPVLGFIPLGIISVTILHIPVIIAVLYFGPKLGTLSGLVFGLTSMIVSFLRPNTQMDVFFQNPLISVVPRVLFAFLTSMVYIGLNRVSKNRYVNGVIASVIGSIIHSVLVLGTLAIVEFPELTEQGSLSAAVILALTVIGTAGLAEAVAAGLLAPPVVRALDTITRKEEYPVNELLSEIDQDNK